MDLKDKIVHVDNAGGLDSCQSIQSRAACNSHGLNTANSMEAKDNGVAVDGLIHTDVLDRDSDCQTISVFWEVEQGESQISDVRGRLRKCLDFWETTLEPPPWIISCISNGYKLSLRAIPEKFSKPNQQSALAHRLCMAIHPRSREKPLYSKSV